MIQIYIQKIWEFDSSNEIEYTYAGRYGAKGEKRNKKVKPTPEQMEKQNQINKENRVRRLIKANFKKYDLWCTLKYPKGTRKEISEVQKDLSKFTNKLRAQYKKRGEQLKFISRIEIGKLGGIHIHILINRIPDSDILISKCWTPGTVYFGSLYENGGFRKLAEYIVKKTESSKMEDLDEKERKQGTKYSSSRNLIRPVPKVKKYTRRTVRKIIENGPTPTKGYYIDEETLTIGDNQYTGYSYIKYIELRADSPP